MNHKHSLSVRIGCLIQVCAGQPIAFMIDMNAVTVNDKNEQIGAAYAFNSHRDTYIYVCVCVCVCLCVCVCV